jgi:hypothetical protein
MKNYCRLSGDGSVKVVLSGDSNSPPKTTPRREPLPYNSSPTQELRPSVACPSRVRVPAPSRCHTLPSSPTTDHGQLATDKPANVDFSISELLRFQKKPVFAPPPFAKRTSILGNIIVAGLGSQIRGLFSRAGEFPNVDVCPSESLCLRDSVVKLSQPQNVDSAPPLVPSVQNPFKKARESATTFREANVNAGQHYRGGLGKPQIHVSTFDPSSAKPSNFQTLNLRTVPRTSHLVSLKNARNSSFLNNSTSTSHQKVDFCLRNLGLGTSFVLGVWPVILSRFAPLSLQKINFSVSATLKQPPLQMSHLRQFFTEIVKNTETLPLPFDSFVALYCHVLSRQPATVIHREALLRQLETSQLNLRHSPCNSTAYVDLSLRQTKNCLRRPERFWRKNKGG